MSGICNFLSDNIFNVNYIASSLSQYQVIPGMPSKCRMQFSYMYRRDAVALPLGVDCYFPHASDTI